MRADRRTHERRAGDHIHDGVDRRRGGRRDAVVTLSAVILLFGWTLSDAQIYTRRNTNGVIEATNVPTEIDFRLTYASKGTLIHSRAFRRVYSGQYDRHIEDAANANGVSSDLIRAIIAVESEFDAFAVSSKGAQGLMQLMPFTARRFGVANSFDARQNIFGGVKYLRFLLDMFGGDVALACAGYNAGENAVTRHKGIPPYKETQNYVRRIRSLLSGISPVIGYAPARLASAKGPAADTRPKKVKPARPRTYYKYVDDRGVLHVAHTPPAEGILYTMIRALD